MDFSIRIATEEDAEPISELLNPIIRSGMYSIMVDPLSVDEQIGWIREVSKRGVFHVAVCDGRQEILGFQSVEPISTRERAWSHVGDISTFVSLGAHRHGIGRSLSSATFKAAKEQGFLKIRATMRADNPLAVSFYLSQGFRVIGTAPKHAFVHGQYIDEILMETFLD